MKYPFNILLGGMVGTMVEAYDISICYFLSSELTHFLIGNENRNPAIVLTIIFICNLVKPIGAVILGFLSDKYGRKNILTLSIVGMGCSTCLIGMIPSFQTIGSLAIILLFLFRVIQSLSLGSEFLNSTSFLVESTHQNKRGLFGCFTSVGVKLGFLLACLITVFSNKIFISEWAWRVPFLLAALTTLVGLLIRLKLPESLGYIIYYAEHKKPSTKTLYTQSYQFLTQNPFLCSYAFFASFISVASGFMYYLYLPIHAKHFTQISNANILTSTTISLTFLVIMIPVFGWLSDRFHRLTMQALATIAMIALSIPLMNALNHENAYQFTILQLLISIPCACYYSVCSVLLTELFPLPIRCTCLSVIFSIAASLGAGLPPVLANYLTAQWSVMNAPGLLMIVALTICLFHIKILRNRLSAQAHSVKFYTHYEFG